MSIGTVSSVMATEDYWVTKEPMQQARSGLGVATVNGKIYAIGGTTTSGFAPSIPGSAVLGNRDIGGFVGTNEEYDPETDTWTFKAFMPTPRILFATAICRRCCPEGGRGYARTDGPASVEGTGEDSGPGYPCRWRPARSRYEGRSCGRGKPP